MSTQENTEENPEQILSSLRKEMTLIKAEETSLKKQILSLNEQFQELMVSVAELYPDILNEEFAQKPAGSPEGLLPKEPHAMSTRYKDRLQRMDKKSRWNEWREGRVRRRYSGGDMDLKEKQFVGSGGTTRKEKTRPSSLNVDELSEHTIKAYGKRNDPTKESAGSPDSEFTTPRGDMTGDNTRAASPGSNDNELKLMTLDSERRRRIRQRLKESRKKLDVVHLGLF